MFPPFSPARGNGTVVGQYEAREGEGHMDFDQKVALLRMRALTEAVGVRMDMILGDNCFKIPSDSRAANDQGRCEALG